MIIKKLLQKYNLRPNKRLGQNFLINQKILQRVIQTAKLSKKDVVLEIGPGLGILTQELAKKAKKVIAVEKDKQIIGALKENLKSFKNIEIVQGDIRFWKPNLETKFPLGNLVSKFKIVANIPYYLTSPLIRKFLEADNPPQEMVLLIQKEVAQRICAKPPKMNLLAVSVQFYSQPKIMAYVSKKSFWPQPKVDAAIIKISQIQKPKNINIENFFKLVKAGFAHPRKQLVTNVNEKINHHTKNFGGVVKKALAECGLNSQARAQDLSIDDWKSLMLKFHFPGDNP